MKLAVLADIHGNGEALRAVLTDVDERGGADRLLVLGDIVLLGPDPGQVVKWLMARDALGVRGNVDRFLLGTDWHAIEPQNKEERADQALCLWAWERLDERARAWLRALPFQQELTVNHRRLFLAHGSPRSDTDAICADTPEESVREMLTGVQADLILLGHTHEPLDRTVGKTRLINPGCVGYPHQEAGTARYALFTWEKDWRVDFRLVHYDAERAVTRLLAAHRPYRRWIADMLLRADHVPLTTLE